ncbi:YbhB/YbcL family Raf kinase inhibitor-like protein [Nitrosomonas sp.]|uniref:YbhB/YbcL family Raf kinase inhibitor-like protein n=1 Tax=Nitrosomonas sp. TaxID=42353 RepID=UPI00341C9EFB
MKYYRESYLENADRPRFFPQIALIALMIALFACFIQTTRAEDDSSSINKEKIMALTLTSPSFTHGGMIPTLYTCDGQDISPALSWSGVPDHAKSLVLIIDDPDAPDPDAPKMTWVHWVLYNIPPHVNELPENIAGNKLPTGTLQGINDWKRTGYGGPCPPIGVHRYFHKLYALDVVLPDLKHPTKSELEAAMQGHIITQTELIGRYHRRSQETD